MKMISVPSEATAFLGAVGAFMVLLVVFYLYLNKKFCFTTIGGFPCCDVPLKGNQNVVSKDLGSAFAYEDPESSTDSEDEVLQRLQRSVSSQSAILRKQGSNREEQPADSSLQEGTGEPANLSHASLSATARGAEAGTAAGGQEGHSPHEVLCSDLISLAEKGRIGKLGSSFSSETSADTAEEEDATTPFLGTRQQQYLNDAFDKWEDSACASREDFVESTAEERLDEVEQAFSGEMAHHEDSSMVTRCGAIEVGLSYDSASRKITVNVLQAQDVPSRDRGGANQVQVRLILLPHKKQKHRTKIRSGSNPQFRETFTFTRINPEDLSNMGIRFRLYGCERMRREHLIGECMVSFAFVRLQEQQTDLWLKLEPRANLVHSDSKSEVMSLARSDSTGSAQSMQHTSLPELLLGLAYNGTTGRLTVSVIKGSQFRNATMNRAPDTYVKLSLVSSNGQEIARSKTSMRRGQPNPLYKETFVFQVALFQLPDVTLMVSIYNKRSMKRKEMIGWFSLGLNSSGEEELAHWNDMRENKGEQVCRWHVLLES